MSVKASPSNVFYNTIKKRIHLAIMCIYILKYNYVCMPQLRIYRINYA